MSAQERLHHQAAPETGREQAGAPRRVVTPRRGAMLRTLRELRVEASLSLGDLADQSGVNKGTISQLERGRLVASPAELDAIGGVLDRQLEVRTLVVYEERV